MQVVFLLLLLSGTADREEIRFSYCGEQGYDSSCGLSVLACLMDRYWGIPADELGLANEFFAEKLAAGDFTVSLADMAAVLGKKGFACKAYRMTYEQLGKAVGKYGPAVVHYDRPNGHFALALAMRGEEVLIADPAEGTILAGRDRFETRWSGKVLVAILPGGKLDSALLGKAEASAWGRGELLDSAAMADIGAELR
jgi:predicted double-glycine peptidase